MNNKRLYFYSPGDNTYLAPVDLFVIAKNAIRDNGIHWLEPVWKCGPTADRNGLMLFTSKLDAIIYTMVLNENSEETWNVYPFADVSVTEMMIDVAQEQEYYHIHLIFAFSADKNKHIKYKNGSLGTLGFLESFAITKNHSALSPIILKFPEFIFTAMNEYWASYYSDYCQLMKIQNSLPAADLMNTALIAVSEIKTSTAIDDRDFESITHFSLNEKKWVTSFITDDK